MWEGDLLHYQEALCVANQVSPASAARYTICKEYSHFARPVIMVFGDQESYSQ